MSFFMASTDPLEAFLHLSRDEVTTPSWRTSLQLLRVKVWAMHSALLVRMGVRIQCFLSCLTGVMQFYIKVFCLSRKTNSYPCPLAAYRRLLLGLFFLSSLAFWMASFFSFICVTDEAKRQPKKFITMSSLRSWVLYPAFPYFSICQSSFLVFYVNHRVILVLRRIGKGTCTPSFQKQKLSQKHFNKWSSSGREWTSSMLKKMMFIAINNILCPFPQRKCILVNKN